MRMDGQITGDVALVSTCRLCNMGKVMHRQPTLYVHMAFIIY